MLFAEGASIDRPQLGMVASSSFSNVVKQGCNKQECRVSQALGNARCDGKGIGVVGAKESTAVGNHLHGMRIDRVGMKHIELHLSDNGAKGRQVSGEDAMS